VLLYSAYEEFLYLRSGMQKEAIYARILRRMVTMVWILL